MGPYFLPYLTNSIGIGNWFDLRQPELRLNARKDKGSEAGLASEFAAADNCREARILPKSDIESKDVQQPVFIDVGAQWHCRT